MPVWRVFMRTTLDLSAPLLEEAMALTKIRTKTEVITRALENLIQKEKVQQLKNYYGKIDLDIVLSVRLLETSLAEISCALLIVSHDSVFL